MTTYNKMIQTIQDLGALLATEDYLPVMEVINVQPEVLAEGPAMVAELEAGRHKQRELRGHKQNMVAEKNVLMRKMRKTRALLGDIMRLNFAGTSYLHILEMEAQYRTVIDEHGDPKQVPVYDRRETTEYYNMKLILDNLAEFPPEVRDILARAGWHTGSEVKFQELLTAWETACKGQKQLENRLDLLIEANRALLAKANRWYRNMRHAARSLKDDYPQLTVLIEKAFPTAVAKPRRTNKNRDGEANTSAKPQQKPPNDKDASERLGVEGAKLNELVRQVLERQRREAESNAGDNTQANDTIEPDETGNIEPQQEQTPDKEVSDLKKSA